MMSKVPSSTWFPFSSREPNCPSEVTKCECRRGIAPLHGCVGSARALLIVVSDSREPTPSPSRHRRFTAAGRRERRERDARCGRPPRAMNHLARTSTSPWRSSPQRRPGQRTWCSSRAGVSGRHQPRARLRPRGAVHQDRARSDDRQPRASTHGEISRSIPPKMSVGPAAIGALIPPNRTPRAAAVAERTAFGPVA